MKLLRRCCILLLFTIVFVRAAEPMDGAGRAPTPLWMEDWELMEGFALERVSTGFDYPVSAAFVPNPGPNPDDPLYYVIELRGKVKVVTNDGSIHTFADGLTNFKPRKELPDTDGESGSAGLCLEPTNGYVFVTYIYKDQRGVLRNGITRFETKPETFGITPASEVSFDEIFANDYSSVSHQIGFPQVYNGHLYVGVGDGEKSHYARDLEHTNGKILRMTLDGEPVSDNPFYQEGLGKSTANYIWAMGLRNPFGIKVMDDRVFVTDNGPSADRFLEIDKGADYLWSRAESNWDHGTRADLMLAPAVSPVGMEFYDGKSGLLPENYRNHFFVALAGKPGIIGPGPRGGKSIIHFGYDLDERIVSVAPQSFLRYRGTGRQMVVWVGFGPGGLYFIPLFDGNDGESGIFKIVKSPDEGHIYGLNDFTKYYDNPEALLAHKGCLHCHSLEEDVVKIGPSLARIQLAPRLNKHLNSDEYLGMLAELEASEIESDPKFNSMRESVVNLTGMDRVRTWMKYHLLEPRFDNPSSQMPNMGLTEVEAGIIGDYLLSSPLKTGTAGMYSWVMDKIGKLRFRHLVLSFAFGTVAGALPLLGFVICREWMLRRRAREVSNRRSAVGSVEVVSNR